MTSLIASLTLICELRHINYCIVQFFLFINSGCKNLKNVCCNRQPILCINLILDVIPGFLKSFNLSQSLYWLVASNCALKFSAFVILVRAQLSLHSSIGNLARSQSF